LSAAARATGALSTTLMLTPNSILQNRYLIVRLLGEGGMGAVYEAIDQRVSCLVALKETRVGSRPETRQAFQREAALLANLRQAALPKVMDYFGEGEGEFLVMEFIPGHDLAERLALRDGPFPEEQVVRWANEILKLLEYLHTHEPAIIHRDIKPANLKVTSQGEIFLLDFGLAKGAAGQMATIQTSESVYGYTPSYAPLEQIHGRGTDPRSDLYALGATMYHLLTGQPPLNAPARFEAVENDRPDPLKPANQLNFLVSPEITGLIQSAMALRRKDRPATAAEMRIALEHAARVVADRENARKAEAALIETLPGGGSDDSARPLVTDKDVQFTVYAPQKIKPEKNYSVLAFAHLAKKRADAPEDEPDPIAEMKEQAARILGDQLDDYSDPHDSSRQAVPRGGQLTFVPLVQGINFSPSSRSFNWRKSVHREEFDMWASRESDGKTLNGSMTVFLGSVVIAEVALTISVDSQASSSAERISLDGAQSARRVQQVFASYSPRDEQVVAELAHVAPIFGSRFLTDRTHLEPGEDRIEGLQRLIRDADVFQLFWSTNSMRSPETVSEIKYAASLGRPGFILPTYWEEPVPRSPAEGLPPPEIERLQFYRIYPGAISKATLDAKAETRLVIMGPAGAEIFIDDERHGSLGRSGRIILKSIPPGRHVLRLTRSGYQDDERVIEIRVGSDEQVIHAEFGPVPTSGAALAFGIDESLSASSSPDMAQESSRVTAPLEMPRDETPTGELALPLETIPVTAPLEMPRDVTPTGELAPRLETIPSSPPAYFDAGVSGRPPAGTVVCPSCRTSYPSGMKFCGRCGITLSVTRVRDSTEPAATTVASVSPQNFQAPDVARRRRGLMMPIFAGAAVILFAVIVAPVLFMMSNRGNRGQNITTSSRPNATPLGPSNTSANANNSFESLPISQFRRLEGGTVQLKDLHGRVVLLNFWATWCAPCRTQIPALNELQKTFEPRGVSVIGITYNETVESVRSFQKQTPQDFQIGFVGNEIGALFGSSDLPATYILDRRGRVRKKMIGAQSRAAFEAAIEPLINEGP
jgi:serine/threonine protein kinase/thiol-disulfide isomerase/thioredoxin